LPQKPALTFVPDPDQVIGQTIADAFGELVEMSRNTALARLNQVLLEIDQSLFGIPPVLY